MHHDVSRSNGYLTAWQRDFNSEKIMDFTRTVSICHIRACRAWPCPVGVKLGIDYGWELFGEYIISPLNWLRVLLAPGLAYCSSQV